MAKRAKTLKEVSEILGPSPTTLYRHRDGNKIVFDDGRELKIFIMGRRMYVADIEIARFLGESETGQVAS
jgi:hypothetical protein